MGCSPSDLTFESTQKEGGSNAWGIVFEPKEVRSWGNAKREDVKALAAMVANSGLLESKMTFEKNQNNSK